MNSKISKVVTAIVTLAFLVLCASSAPAHDDNGLFSFIHLGDIDGVRYYADGNASMNWTDAFNYCNYSGVTLARVTTKNQSAFLGAALQENYGSSEFWTQGRDSFTPQSQVWEDTQVSPDASVFSSFVHMGQYDNTTYHFCSYVWAGETNSLYLYVHLCSQEKLVLCQTQ